MDVIQSEQFILRPYQDSDQQSLIESINDIDVSRYTTNIPFPYETKDAVWWLNHCKEEEAKQDPLELIFAIDIVGRVAGNISLTKIEKGHQAEIGYWLGKEYWGRGIMTEAAKLIVQFAFEKLNLVRIYGTVFHPNKPSMRVLEKAGFEFEGVMKKAVQKNGQFFDLHLYAIVR